MRCYRTVVSSQMEVASVSYYSFLFYDIYV